MKWVGGAHGGECSAQSMFKHRFFRYQGCPRELSLCYLSLATLQIEVEKQDTREMFANRSFIQVRYTINSD